FETVGGLYRGIRDGFESLAARLGERALFVGDPSAQLGPSDVLLDGLLVVTDVATALRAIDNIVEQGEGNVDNPESSHYRKFCQVRDELAAMTKADPTFAPARPVAKNPVQRQPPLPEGKTWIQAPDAARVLDFANALYNHMLRLLGAAYEPLPAAARRGLIAESIAVMKALSPANDVLTRLPASEQAAAPTGGISFAVTREIRVPTASALVDVASERTRDLAEGARSLASIAPELAKIGDQLGAMAERLAKLPRGADAPRGEAQAAPGDDAKPKPKLEQAADPTIPPRTIVDGVEIIEGEKLQLRFDTKRCIHARFCVMGAPEVFIGNIEGPWIRPDAVHVEHLTAIAQRCPSGAITYTRKDGGPDETPPSVNSIRIREDGPYAIEAELLIDGAAPRTRATLCRCGASKRKPFCDGSHVGIDFRATGEPPTGNVKPLAVRDGKVVLRPLPDGPLQVEGNLEICTGTGRTVAKVQKATLCRCGHSKNKPFCDGTHRSVGFSTAATSEI
ncbi:MAG TPA: CDGSH iron-sulfur domain-containing protein, partial [Gaiellaceae bacterium]|nr:CDGSH iron-sulfur domain-containing protein [Gaiellaceae bacterium]